MTNDKSMKELNPMPGMVLRDPRDNEYYIIVGWGKANNEEGIEHIYPLVLGNQAHQGSIIDYGANVWNNDNYTMELVYE